jgi:hypothetical protein
MQATTDFAAVSHKMESIKDLVTQGTVSIANKYFLTEEEASHALVVMTSPHARKSNLRFPCSTAGLRKLCNLRIGVWDGHDSTNQCVDVPMFYYDWYYNKTKGFEGVVEYGKILGQEEWKRCESTGLWFYKEKPQMTCQISTCRACEPYERVFEGQNRLIVKFYFWDPECRDFQSYLRFYQRFFLLFEKDRLKNPDQPYDFRQARFMMVKRQATGDFNFRYNFSENFITEYISNHLRFAQMDQIVDLPLEIQVQIFNTVLNDTILLATQDEVKRWIEEYKNDPSNDYWTITHEVGDDVELAKPQELEVAYLADPEKIPFFVAQKLHKVVPTGCRVSSFRMREYHKKNQELFHEKYNTEEAMKKYEKTN